MLPAVMSACLVAFHTVNKFPFCELFNATFFFFCIFVPFVVILLFKMAPEDSATVLSSVPKKDEKAVTYLREKMC